MKRTLCCAVLLAACGGCASNFKLAAPNASLRNAGLINDPQQADRLEKALTDGDIAKLLDVNVQAKLPTGVAVARLVSQCGGYQPKLDTLDAEELAAWEKALGDRKLVTGVHPVTPLVHASDSPTLHSLRTAAARLNCELLLVYLQADGAVDNFNDAAVLYWTLAGLWLVPGNTYEHRTVMQAVLVDCRTGMVLGTATGDSHRKQIYAAAYQGIQQPKLARQARAAALSDVQKSFGKLLPQVVESALAADARRQGQGP